MTNKKYLIPFSLFITSIALLWGHFKDVFLHPNGYLFAQAGDGLKNYFVFGYYLKYDRGLDFTGVNYPYGENLLFTDSHPLYVALLNLIDDHLFPIAHYSVGIINLSLLLGMAVSGIFVYAILRHYKLPEWYAVIISLCLVFLAPQWARLQGHLSLSYAFVIPMFWYLLIRFNETNSKVKWTILVVSSGLVAGGIHLYYLGIYAVLLLSYGLVLAVSKDIANKNRLKILIQYALLAFGPLLFYLMLSSMTDHVDDRPSSPYGFYAYYATMASVFLPEFSAVTKVVTDLISPRINWEGRAFVGTPAVVFTIIFVVIFARQIFKKETLTSYLPNKELNLFLIAAILSLLFSMCLPFRWGLQFITDIIKPLNQFRALGRFSWIFFYMVNLTAAYYLYHFYLSLKAKNLKILASTLLVGGLLTWCMDATAHYLAQGRIQLHPNTKLESTSEEYQSRITAGEYEIDDFQGIMALPIVSIRTDKLLIGSNLTGLNEAMKASFHTGLPIVQSSASRPSFSQAHSSIQMISSEYIQKTRLRDMDDRPLLLLVAKGSVLTEGERRLLEGSTSFWEDSYISLHLLPLKAFDDNLDSVRRGFLNEKDKFDQVGNSFCDPSCSNVVFEGFEKNTGHTVFQGQGSFYSSRGEEPLFSASVESDSAEVSFWVYVDPKYHGMPSYEYFYGPDEQSLTSNGKKEFRDVSDVVRNWVRVSFDLSPAAYHKIMMVGKKITVDNLLVKPRSTNYYRTADGELSLYNNFPTSN